MAKKHTPQCSPTCASCRDTVHTNLVCREVANIGFENMHAVADGFDAEIAISLFHKRQRVSINFPKNTVVFSPKILNRN